MRVLAGTIVALGLAASARADLDTVNAALLRGDHEAAVTELRPLAEGGDGDAQTLLGKLYLEGRGVPASYSLAWSWFNRAAKGGNAEAQYRLAKMYWDGVGVPRNEREAVRWYEAAADQGHQEAQLEVGLIYRDGRRQIPSSPTNAHDYLSRAAAQGNPEAALALEEMFARGTAPPDVQQAYSTEQQTREMSEADRIRNAVVDWIETINRGGGGPALRIGPEVAVAETDDGFNVLIPDLVLTPQPATVVRAGTLRVKLTAIGETPEEPEQDLMTTRRYLVEATLPERIQLQRNLETYTLTFAASELRGLWLPDSRVFVEGRTVLDGLALVDQAGRTVFTAGQAVWAVDFEETEPGLWSGPSSLEVTDIAVFDPTGARRMSVGRFVAGSRFRDFMLEPYSRMTTEMRADPGGFLARLLQGQSGTGVVDTLTGLMSFSAFELAVEEMVAFDESGTRPMGGLARLTVGGEATLQEAGQGALRISYGHAGLDIGDQVAGAGQALLPTDADLSLTVNSIPVETLLRLMLEMYGRVMIEAAQDGEDASQPPPKALMAKGSNRLAEVLSEARTDVALSVSLATEASPLSLDGLLVAESDAAFGATGDIEVRIGDLDRVMALARGEPTLAAYLPVIESFAEVAEHDAGQGESATFRVAIQPDGTVLVNGHDAIELSVGGTVE